MERITLFIRTTKTSGKIKLRFRLTEGRGVQLYHKSQIEADLADLKKFDTDSSLKPRVSIYNVQLLADIQREIGAMREAYKTSKRKAMLKSPQSNLKRRLIWFSTPTSIT